MKIDELFKAAVKNAVDYSELKKFEFGKKWDFYNRPKYNKDSDKVNVLKKVPEEDYLSFDNPVIFELKKKLILECNSTNFTPRKRRNDPRQQIPRGLQRATGKHPKPRAIRFDEAVPAEQLQHDDADGGEGLQAEPHADHRDPEAAGAWY